MSADPPSLPRAEGDRQRGRVGSLELLLLEADVTLADPISEVLADEGIAAVRVHPGADLDKLELRRFAAVILHRTALDRTADLRSSPGAAADDPSPRAQLSRLRRLGFEGGAVVMVEAPSARTDPELHELVRPFGVQDLLEAVRAALGSRR